jgi:putative transposase
MGHSYHRFFYHFAWATKMREPMLTPEVEEITYRYIRKRCKDMGVFVYALNGIEDHTHLVCSIPPKLAVAEVLEKLKGGSSHYINHLPDRSLTLYWQRGYGGFTFAGKDLDKVVEYVDNQKERHRTNRLWATFEQFGDEPDQESKTEK